ncbi:MAG: translation initiation factor IF-2, partial [Candidatus Hydrogenedentes bacterium]|nr:translation initiation factor IF-2 [Candidatus Hydrogenedentota bacterium]
DTPKTTPPRAEIIVESEEEARVAAELLDKAREDGTHAEGKLAAAEHRREEEERRRVTREKERQEKKVQGPVVSDIAPDPEVVAAVMRRNEDRKRKAEEDKARRQRRRPAGSERKKPLSAPISEPLAPVAPVVASPNKTKGKPDQSGLSKTARKKAKRAERNRLRAENSRREAAEAVKNFQAGTITGGSRKKRRRRRDEQMVETTEQQVLGGGIIEVDEMVTVQILANLMDMPVTDLILTLMDEDMSATKNQTLDMAVVRLIAGKFNFEVRVVIPEEEELFAEEKDDPAQLQGRPPVVTVMGHVDHGKTSLLDVIRSAKVAEGEAGGITQHIAAYDIEVSDGRVTFLDTPGHQAFTEMRARGAHVTDVVVLVVAANDGVKPQTIEAIDHAQAAEVPIVVAINKCDLDNAQPDRVRQELSQHGLVDDAWGGKTIMRDISAKMNQGIDELMELLVLQTDMLELKANPEKRARGTIVESEIAVGLGPVAWVLVQNGTLRIGDIFLAGTTYGRVRSMITCRNENVEEAGPSTPVLVTGFDAPPDAGDIFITVPEERVARNIAEQRASRLKLKRSTASKHMTLEDFHAHFDGKEQKKLKMIIKSDVQGSVDVLRTSFAKMGNEEVSINVIHSGVGGINESDVVLAEASDAVIIGFHVTANAKVQKLAEQVGVDVHTYRIIYEALDEVRSSLEGMLTPDQKEIILGHAEVRQIFASSALGNIAGCYQTDGESQRNASARLVRDGVVIYEGNISSLRRKKDDARSVATGFECGIKLEKYNDIHIGDIIEVFKVELVAKTLKEEMQ